MSMKKQPELPDLMRDMEIVQSSESHTYFGKKGSCEWA